MIISLTGFMGCGKSSVGRKLAELLGWRFMDLDSVIEEREGRTIPEMFAQDGEKEFRKTEKEVLESILCECSDRSVPSAFGKEPQFVLALGGGAVTTPECERMVHEKTYCVYLKASVDTLIEHLLKESSDRPLLNSSKVHADKNSELVLRSRIMELMVLRGEIYERTAHIIIDIDGKCIDKVAEEIVQSLSN